MAYYKSGLRFDIETELNPDIVEELGQHVAASASQRIGGQLFLITRPRQFFEQAAISIDSVDTADFVPFPGLARVTMLPSGLVGGSALPGISTLVETNGTFAVLVPPPPFGPRFQLRFSVPGTNGAPDKLIYRSEVFDVNDVNIQNLRIFVFPIQVPDTIGVTQEQINEKVATAHQSEDLKDLDHLSATINSGGLHVTAIKGRATINFDLRLLPSKSISLDRFITHSFANFVIDLPRLAGCFINERKIEDKITAGIADLVTDINKGLEDTLAAALANIQDEDPAVVLANMQEILTLTFTAARFPVVDTGPGMGGSTVQEIRNIVFDASFGTPRKLG